MESTGSNSPPVDHHRPATAGSYPAQYLADRITRALVHRLRLLHRSNADFFVLGATGNVYNVTLSAMPSCTCPDRTVPCKHILFVFIRVLGVSLDDACLRRRTLRPCQLKRLLGSPTSPDILAGVRARERFQQLFLESGCTHHEGSGNLQEGAVCPVCLEEMGGGGGGGGVVTCATCGNSLHGECLLRWKRSRERRVASCVMCRARWRERKEPEGYVNLAAYTGDDDMAVGHCAG